MQHPSAHRTQNFNIARNSHLKITDIRRVTSFLIQYNTIAFDTRLTTPYARSLHRPRLNCITGVSMHIPLFQNINYLMNTAYKNAHRLTVRNCQLQSVNLISKVAIILRHLDDNYSNVERRIVQEPLLVVTEINDNVTQRIAGASKSP
jgi:hypothetical protein